MLRKVVVKFSIIRQYSSALYITGDKAHKHFAVLTPIIDFDEQLKNKNLLIKNLQLRQLPIELNAVEERWNFYKDIDNKKIVLEQTRIEIGQTIAQLIKLNKNEAINKEVAKLKLHLKLVKEDLKNVRNMSYGIEEAAALQVLNLPNKLHEKTPDNDELEVYRYLEKDNNKSQSHLVIGQKLGYIKLINPMSCYLMSQAALFEYALQNYFNAELINANYVQWSNSDFVKSIIVEGCGGHNGKDFLTLGDIHCIKSDDLNKLHLVGASSLYSFMAYFTKHCVQKQKFPLRFFCIGRKYQEVNDGDVRSLFNLNQSSNIGIFMASVDELIVEDIVNELSHFYKQLGFHFKIVIIPAHKLANAESLRISIQMFSNNLLNYVEVGHVSFYGDYISKRLLFNYNNENKERFYPNVIGGSLINVQKVIGCVLENNSLELDKPLVNEFLCKYL